MQLFPFCLLGAFVIGSAAFAADHTGALSASLAPNVTAWIPSAGQETKRFDHVMLVGTGGVGGSSACRALISFDLSSIPSGAVIQSVTLELLIDRRDPTSDPQGSVGVELYVVPG